MNAPRRAVPIDRRPRRSWAKGVDRCIAGDRGKGAGSSTSLILSRTSPMPQIGRFQQSLRKKSRQKRSAAFL